jgi:hypothetical protein
VVGFPYVFYLDADLLFSFLLVVDKCPFSQVVLFASGNGGPAQWVETGSGDPVDAGSVGILRAILQKPSESITDSETPHPSTPWN